MKKVEELGISPAPWSACTPTKREVAVAGLKDDEFRSVQAVALCRAEGRNADARLIAAAPELYECLREAVELLTHGTPTPDGVKKWRNALEKAGGAE